MIKSEKGFSLLEVLVALALLGLIATVFLMALTVGSGALLMADVRTTAESLARSQMEYIRTQPYDAINVPPQIALLNPPDGFTIAVTAVRLDPKGDGPSDDGIQKITVTIYHHYEPVITLEGLRVGH